VVGKIQEHNHSDALSGIALMSASVAAGLVFGGGLILSHVWGLSQPKCENILAIIFSFAFCVGVKRGTIGKLEYGVKQLVAVIASMVTIYTANTGLQFLASQRHIEVVGGSSVVPASIIPLGFNSYPKENPNNKKYHVQEKRYYYQVEIPKECGGGFQFLPERKPRQKR